MAGVLVFRSLHEALKAGYTVYDRLIDGYLVRQKIADRWQLAIVSFADRPTLAEHPDSAQLDFGARRHEADS